MLLLAALLLAPFAQEGSRNFAADQRLKKPIGLHDKIVSLKTFTEDLQRESGVRMEVAANIADRKITALFHDRPVAEVMTAVKTLFFMDWQPTKSGYRLVLPNNIQMEEQAILDLEARLARAAVERKMSEWAEIGQTPEAMLDAERQRLADESRGLLNDKSDAGKARLAAIRTRLGTLGDPLWAAVAAAQGPHLRDRVDDLLDGGIVFGSTRPTDRMPQISPDILNIPQLNPAQKWTSAVALARYDEDEQILTGALKLTSSAGEARSILPSTHLIDENDTAWSASPLAERMRKWADIQDAAIMARKLSLPEPPKSETGYLSKAYSLAEHLEYVAARADVPILADAYRMRMSPEVFVPAGTVGTYLAALRPDFSRHSFPYNKLLVHVSGGWLMARSDAYWRQLAREIPERILVPLEQRTASKTGATVDDFAAFAANLTPRQARMLGQRCMAMVVRFSRHPLMSIPPLRLLATLNPAQRAEAQKVDGLSLADMGGLQQALYFDALVAVTQVGHIPDSLLPALLPNAYPNGLAFFLGQKRGKTQVWPEDLPSPDQPQQPQTIDGWSVHFEFGPAAGDRMSIGFQISAKG